MFEKKLQAINFRRILYSATSLTKKLHVRIYKPNKKFINLILFVLTAQFGRLIVFVNSLTWAIQLFEDEVLNRNVSICRIKATLVTALLVGMTSLADLTSQHKQYNSGSH